MGSAGIAMIGTLDGVRPTTPALVSLQRLIAWRLDVAHVDPAAGRRCAPPATRATRRRIIAAPARQRPSRRLAQRLPGRARSIPLLPAVARAPALIGLPKIWNPRSTSLRRLEPGRSTTVRFRADLLEGHLVALRVLGPLMARSPAGRACGAVVDWTWRGRAPVLRSGAYRAGTLRLRVRCPWIGRWARCRDGCGVPRRCRSLAASRPVTAASLSEVDGDVASTSPGVIPRRTNLPSHGGPVRGRGGSAFSLRRRRGRASGAARALGLRRVSLGRRRAPARPRRCPLP